MCLKCLNNIWGHWKALLTKILLFLLNCAFILNNNTSKTSNTAKNVNAKSNILAAVSCVYVCVGESVCECVFVLLAAVLASEIMYMLMRKFWQSDAECDVQQC